MAREPTWKQILGPSLVRRVVIASVVVGLAVGLGGMDWQHATYLALATAIVMIAFSVLTAGAAVPRWDENRAPERPGTRLEVAALAWALLGRRGRVGELALRRLREIADGRLARHGLSLTDPRDAGDIRALLGQDAWAVLTSNAGLPTRRDIEVCVRALEAADPAPTTTARGPRELISTEGPTP